MLLLATWWQVAITWTNVDLIINEVLWHGSISREVLKNSIRSMSQHARQGQESAWCSCWYVTTYDFHPRHPHPKIHIEVRSYQILFVLNTHQVCVIFLTFCTAHGGDNRMFCEYFQNSQGLIESIFGTSYFARSLSQEPPLSSSYSATISCLILHCIFLWLSHALALYRWYVIIWIVPGTPCRAVGVICNFHRKTIWNISPRTNLCQQSSCLG